MLAQPSPETDTATEFDLGPLSWVHGEIGQALARGMELLATFRAEPSDATALKQARNHVHQAAGAIQMVGLDGAVVYADEIERQLARLEELAPAEIGPACAQIDRACRLLRIFLDEIVGGSPPVPLKLFPEYEALQRARGIRSATPTDLFFPELALRAPVLEAHDPVPEDRLPSHLVKQRRIYQSGLLLFLRGDPEGARGMRAAVAGIERASTRERARTFWWTVGAFYDAIIARGLEPGLGVKQLAGRIDLQIRRLVEGSTKVADRLRREVLYYVAISKPVAPSVQAVQKGFGLARLIPSADVLNADLVRLQPILRDTRERLAAARELWLKVASGRVDSLPKLKQTLAEVRANAAEFGNEPLCKLTAALGERLDRVPATGSVPEPVAMEYATGILLAESAVENFGNLSSEFPGQVDAMLARLEGAHATEPMRDTVAAPLLDEMSRRAQERVLFTHVAREIQANLRRMEQVLDAFFRDHSKRADLATLEKESRQIRGAFKILGQDDAERLLALCEEQIDSYAHPDAVVGDVDLELLAESLSGLGFFVEALEQQRPDRQRLIAPLLAKRLGEAPAAQTDRAAETVEGAVEELRSALPALVAEVRRSPADPSARAVLKARLGDLLNDAKLIDDGELVRQALAALAELDAGGTVALTAAVTAIAGSGGAVPAPSPAISEETQRLLATDATGLDAELLDIYLTEAAEVLDAIAGNRGELEARPGDRDALRTVRRQFHTLKGSGRMVGLTELGEIAFDVERIHNRLLEEERPVTAEVLAMIATAERSFRRWIAALKDTGTVAADPAELHAAIRAVEAGLPSEGKTVSAPAPAPEATAETPAAPVAAFAPEAAAETPAAPVAAFVPEAAAEAPAAPVAAFAPESGGVLPELGGALAEAAPQAEEWIVEGEGVGEDAAEVIEFAPVGEVPVAADAAAAVPPAPAEVVVGDVTLPADLYRLLVDEAQTHLATLERELSLLQFDPQQGPSAAMVRASHTLCGIHRAGGLLPVAATASALEQCLLALQQAKGPLPETALPVLAASIHVLRDLVGRVRERTGFDAVAASQAAGIREELDALRQASMAAPVVPRIPEFGAAPEATLPEPAAEWGAGAPEFAPVPPPEEPIPGLEVPEHPAAPAPVHEELAPAHLAAAEPEDLELPLDPLANIRDDVDEQVLPIFLEEAAELYPQAGAQVRAWRRAPGDEASARQLRRTLHTFKGSARMAGAMRLGELAHLMESRLSIDDALTPGTSELFEALDADLDRIAYVLDALRAGKTNVAVPWAIEAAVAAEQPPPALPVSEEPATVPRGETEGAPSPDAAAPAPDVESGARAMLRVRADIIDRLVNEAGEVAITRTQIEGELRALKANLLELSGSVLRLRAQAREIEIQAESQIQSRLLQAGEGAEGFDPLEFDRFTRFQEVARSLAEGVNDVSTVQQSLLKNLDAADGALIAQGRMSREMQQQLFSIRTVPFGSLSERLYRILRGTAKELGKRANLEIRGAQTELDRSVLEKLVGPLEHLLRNAVDHGIEPRDARAKTGKSETGEITLTVRQVGNEIAIELADDGAGLDLGRVRAKAVAQGRIDADAQPTDDQLIKCIFEPGFTTAARVTQVSGRGIGMDVVRSEIAALGGRVQVTTQAGRGTTFLLYLPLTLAVAQAVLVRAGGRLWALPAPMVEQVQHLKADALVNLYVQRRVEWQGMVYPFHYLPRLLGDVEHAPESSRHNAVLLLRSGQNLCAVHVDEMVGNQEVVVKNTGPQLARVPGIAGATVLGNGEILLIINPVQLAQRAVVPEFDPNAERVAPEVPRMAVTQAGRPLVMVVDDSLTVRRITSRLLSREGFDVLTAKDGIEALDVLDGETPDVILLDIEMPRMDGFEFARTLKGDPAKARIPIVMITSRTAEKHRNRAKELGVDLYLGKPFQEEELLRNLREMLALTP